MKETQKLIVTIAVFALLTLGCLVGLYFQAAHIGYGPFKGRDSIAWKMESLQKRLAAAQAKIDQIPEKKQELRKLEAVDRAARQLLPRRRSSDDLLRAIWKKAEEAGVIPRSVEPRKVRGGGEGDYEPLDFAMSIEGRYDNIGVFINRMEEFEVAGKGGRMEKRFFAVKDLTIKNKKSGLHEHGVQTCTLTMETYRYTGEEEEE